MLNIFFCAVGGDSLQLEDGQAVQLEDGTTAYIHTPKGKTCLTPKRLIFSVFSFLVSHSSIIQLPITVLGLNSNKQNHHKIRTLLFFISYFSSFYKTLVMKSCDFFFYILIFLSLPQTIQKLHNSKPGEREEKLIE